MEQHSFISPFLFLSLPCLCLHSGSPDFPLLSLLLASQWAITLWTLGCASSAWADSSWHQFWSLLQDQGLGALKSAEWVLKHDNQGQVHHVWGWGQNENVKPPIYMAGNKLIPFFLVSFLTCHGNFCCLVLCSFGLEILTTSTDPPGCLGSPLATRHRLDPDPPQVCVQTPCQGAESLS